MDHFINIKHIILLPRTLMMLDLTKNISHTSSWFRVWRKRPEVCWVTLKVGRYWTSSDPQYRLGPAKFTRSHTIVFQQAIPDEWRKGIITRLYKGKGKKGKCSNERGITVSSNIGKVYERIIDNRSRPQIKISEAQAGGREGRSTTDHLTILKESIATQKRRKQPLYMVYLDVTKAYDKAWLDALLYVLNKRGIETENWQITNDINTNLTATIKTKYGNTREIKIRDSIRQGGVLSVLMYATVMDEIAEEINKYELGVDTNNTSHPKLGCLLYMDDVVLISNKAQEMQKMLDITNEISSRYRIVFGKEKSKVMKMGSSVQTELKLGDMEIEETDKYKYLGEIINNKGNLEDHIKMLEGKVEAAYQTILHIAKDKNFKGLKMAIIWKLVETCIIPIITYGAESRTTTHKESQKIQTIMNNIIKRILQVPQSTPNDAITIETGILNIQTTTEIKQLNSHMRINKMDQNREIKQTWNNSKRWKQHIDKINTKYNINISEIETKKMSKKWKQEYLKVKILKTTKTEIEDRNIEKTKTNPANTKTL